MTHLPQASGDRVVRALLRAGFVEAHRRGSHVTLIHPDDPTRITTVPVHKGRDLPPGTLRAILRGAKLSADDLRELL